MTLFLLQFENSYNVEYCETAIHQSNYKMPLWQGRGSDVRI